MAPAARKGADEEEPLYRRTDGCDPAGADKTPVAVERFPQRLEDLLEDKRFLAPQRYLRRIYLDPLTGNPGWGLIPAPGGGIAGVYSRAGGRSIGRARNGGEELPEGMSYQEWKFRYEPPVRSSPGA